MNNVAIATAKLAGIKRAVSDLLAATDRRASAYRAAWPESEVIHYFKDAGNQHKALVSEVPYLFGDLPSPMVGPSTRGGDGNIYYGRAQLERLVRDIDQIFEIRANSELGQPVQKQEAKRRVFISHGRASDWRKVQTFIEKDVGLSTIELAQEASMGLTVIEKLFENAEVCDSAVIVMTGDDVTADGQARARENVMHEIGFFQGKYGRRNVMLLHEEGVSIPTNLSGIVYIPFPKDAIEAAFYVVQRELKALYPGI